MSDYIWHDWDFDDLARYKNAKSDELAELRQELKDLDQHMAAVMTEQRVTVEGAGTFERLRGKDRKAWMHEDIARAVAAYARKNPLVDSETGEMESEAEAVKRTLLEAAGISYWKKTSLAAMGLDVDEYCQSTPGAWTIKVSK